MIFKRRRQDEGARAEIAESFKSLEEWEQFIGQNPHLRDRQYIARMAEQAAAVGATEPLTNRSIPAGSLQSFENLREGLAFSSINSRLRAVMLCIQWALTDQVWSDAKIYATEAVTPFALRLRGIFAKFVGSEYAESEEQIQELFPIPCEDLQNLSFPTDMFHIVSTNEVLEHVPSIDAALAEIHRVLRPGGWHIGTAPFAMGQYESIRKAKLEGGNVIHLTEPEYHGNPVDERGSLVFEIPGWDILDRARAAGFSDAYVKYVLSSDYACFSSDAGGIFVICLQK